MLCETCLEIVRAGHKGFPVKRPVLSLSHHADHETLKNSASRGCYVCNKLAVSEQATSTIKLYPLPSGLETGGFWLQTGDRSILFQQCASSHKCCVVDVESKESASSTSDKSVLDNARRWYESCLTNHPQCATQNRSRENDYINLMDLLPTHPRSAENVWCLVKFDGRSEHVPEYMSLSHQWGTEQPLKLTKITHPAMVSGMKDCELPRKYQDAVQIVRAFGIRYLWIDSICIFQDDDLDIQLAACSMFEVYSNSVCNIEALVAQERGIFSERRAGLVGEHAVTICTRESGLDSCYRILDPGIWLDEVDQTPLKKRGWVAQEQILPSRSLLCGENQLLFQCLTSQTCENDPDYQGASIQASGHDVWWPFDDPFIELKKIFGGGILDSEDFDDERWIDFVQTYSALDLTFETDKLIAVSGLARAFHKVTDDSYLAGHWRSQIPSSLLWDCASVAQTKVCSRIEPYAAPTWSWASMNCRVQFRSLSMTRQNLIAQVVGVSVKTKTGDQFSMPQSAVLSLKTPVLHIDLSLNSISLEPDESPRQVMFKPSNNTNPFPSYRTYDEADFYGYMFLDETEVLPQNFTLAVVMAKPDPFETDPEYRTRCQMVGLVLEETEVTRYKRLGLFSVAGISEVLEKWLSNCWAVEELDQYNRHGEVPEEGSDGLIGFDKMVKRLKLIQIDVV